MNEDNEKIVYFGDIIAYFEQAMFQDSLNN